MEKSTEEIAWETPEYRHQVKRSDWYFAVAIITASLSLTAILLDNILFAIVIVLSAFTLSLYAGRKPRIIFFKLTQEGVVRDSITYPFDELDSFWLEDRDGYPRIIFKSAKVTMPFIVFPIEGVPSDDIKGFLDEHLDEEEHHEPIFQKLMEYLGF